MLGGYYGYHPIKLVALGTVTLATDGRGSYIPIFVKQGRQLQR